MVSVVYEQVVEPAKTLIANSVQSMVNQLKPWVSRLSEALLNDRDIHDINLTLFTALMANSLFSLLTNFSHTVSSHSIIAAGFAFNGIVCMRYVQEPMASIPIVEKSSNSTVVGDRSEMKIHHHELNEVFKMNVCKRLAIIFGYDFDDTSYARMKSMTIDKSINYMLKHASLDKMLVNSLTLTDIDDLMSSLPEYHVLTQKLHRLRLSKALIESEDTLQVHALSKLMKTLSRILQQSGQDFDRMPGHITITKQLNRMDDLCKLWLSQESIHLFRHMDSVDCDALSIGFETGCIRHCVLYEGIASMRTIVLESCKDYRKKMPFLSVASLLKNSVHQDCVRESLSSHLKGHATMDARSWINKLSDILLTDGVYDDWGCLDVLAKVSLSDHDWESMATLPFLDSNKGGMRLVKCASLNTSTTLRTDTPKLNN